MACIQMMDADTAACCCAMFMCGLEERKWKISQFSYRGSNNHQEERYCRAGFGDEGIPVLIRHEPDVMAVRVCLDDGRVVAFGAILVGSACKRLACLQHHRVPWDLSSDVVKKAVSPDIEVEAATKSAEHTLEIMFDLPSSHASGFVTDVEHYLRPCMWNFPEFQAAFAIEVLKRFKDPALRWKSRSPFITPCVRGAEDV